MISSRWNRYRARKLGIYGVDSGGIHGLGTVGDPATVSGLTSLLIADLSPIDWLAEVRSYGLTHTATTCVGEIIVKTKHSLYGRFVVTCGITEYGPPRRYIVADSRWLLAYGCRSLQIGLEIV